MLKKNKSFRVAHSSDSKRTQQLKFSKKQQQNVGVQNICYFKEKIVINSPQQELQNLSANDSNQRMFVEISEGKNQNINGWQQKKKIQEIVKQTEIQPFTQSKTVCVRKRKYWNSQYNNALTRTSNFKVPNNRNKSTVNACKMSGVEDLKINFNSVRDHPEYSQLYYKMPLILYPLVEVRRPGTKKRFQDFFKSLKRKSTM